VVGKQITRSADSIGANIAESFGRFNFGEKIQFLYYSRGSLFETKYWLNRTSARELMDVSDVQKYVADLTSLARQLNAFASGLKTVRAEQTGRKPEAVRELASEYSIATPDDFSGMLFSDADIIWLST
jgi:four helix bundle protein